MFVNIKTLVVIELLLIAGLALYRFALLPGQRRIVSTKVAVVILLMPSVAVLSGQIYVYFAFLIIVVAFSSRSRAELGSVFLLMLPMTPVLSFESSVGGTYIVPWSAPLSMFLGALIGFFVTRSRRAATRRSFDGAAVLLVLLFTYISTRDISATAAFRLAAVAVLNTAGPYLLLSRAVSTREDLDLLLLRLALGGVLASIVAVFETLRHWVVYQSLNDALHLPLILGSASMSVRGGRIRAGGPMVGDYSSAGLFFAVVLVILPFLKSRFRPAQFWLIALVLVGGLLATQSRGAWVAALVGFLALMAYRGRVWQAGVIGAVLVAAQAFLLPVLGAYLKSDTFGSGGQASWTVEYRKRLLTRGLEQIAAHPIGGQTNKELYASLPDLVQGQHMVDFVNSHLYIAMAAGIPWFLVWVGIWSLPVIGAWRYRKLNRGRANPAEVPVVIIAVVMTALATMSLLDRNLTWPTAALAIAGPCFALATTRGGGRRAPSPQRPSLITGMPREGEIVARREATPATI